MVESVVSPSESRVTIWKQQLTCTNSFNVLEIYTKHLSVPIEIQKQHLEQNMFIQTQLFSV